MGKVGSAESPKQRRTREPRGRNGTRPGQSDGLRTEVRWGLTSAADTKESLEAMLMQSLGPLSSSSKTHASSSPSGRKATQRAQATSLQLDHRWERPTVPRYHHILHLSSADCNVHWLRHTIVKVKPTSWMAVQTHNAHWLSNCWLVFGSGNYPIEPYIMAWNDAGASQYSLKIHVLCACLINFYLWFIFPPLKPTCRIWKKNMKRDAIAVLRLAVLRGSISRWNRFSKSCRLWQPLAQI